MANGIAFLIAFSIAVLFVIFEAHEIGKIEGYEKGMDDAISTFADIIAEEKAANGID